MEFCATIMNVFLKISMFSDFHGSLMQLKVGDASLKIIEREIERSNMWSDEISTASAEDGGHEKLKKIKSMMKRQDSVFYAALSILLNMGDDISIQFKTVKRSILKYLVAVFNSQFERELVDMSRDLLKLLLRFLKTTSIYTENAERLANDSQLTPFISNLVSLVHDEDKEISITTLYILCNYSHYPALREAIAHEPQILRNVSKSMDDADDNESGVATNLLYILSIENYLIQQFPNFNVVPSVCLRTS